MKTRQSTLGVALLACCALAQAQWEWKDANGTRHLSDQPPPSSVPASRILKAPRGQMPDLRRELAEQPATTPAPTASPAARAAPSTAQRDADFERRRAETAEKAQKASVDAQNKAAETAACDNARANLRVLESGIRIATADRNGEQAFLDEAQKAEQMRRNRDTLATRCR